MDINVLSQMNSHFFRLTHSTKLYRVNTPLTSKKIQRVNSTHRTDLKGVKISSSASKVPKLSITGSPVPVKCQSDITWSWWKHPL